ncbi:Ada metal-binding domain-containing protein [Geomonas agri]|uniref:Ada metal-binding domain-containing protein n=1 Tax=Geomonas agri TaxID=2873702 RepID=UPI001CD3A4F4|nr:Ada metal-binding domain-containing protein [Geomonas agri]
MHKIIIATVIMLFFVTSAFAFVGNKKTHKFHNDDCPSAKRINPANKVRFDSRDQAIKNGYVPCKICRP